MADNYKYVYTIKFYYSCYVNSTSSFCEISSGHITGVLKSTLFRLSVPLIIPACLVNWNCGACSLGLRWPLTVYKVATSELEKFKEVMNTAVIGSIARGVALTKYCGIVWERNFGITHDQLDVDIEMCYGKPRDDFCHSLWTEEYWCFPYTFNLCESFLQKNISHLRPFHLHSNGQPDLSCLQTFTSFICG